jgi:hypothetical protein
MPYSRFEANSNGWTGTEGNGGTIVINSYGMLFASVMSAITN